MHDSSVDEDGDEESEALVGCLGREAAEAADVGHGACDVWESAGLTREGERNAQVACDAVTVAEFEWDRQTQSMSETPSINWKERVGC